MKYFFKTISITLLMVGFMSCGGGGDDSNFQERPMIDVVEDFRNLGISAGINDIVMESTFKGVNWTFRIILPANASEINKRPLIVRLHGAAGVINSDYHKFTACLTEPGFESLNPIILSLNSDGFIWFDIPNQILRF